MEQVLSNSLLVYDRRNDMHTMNYIVWKEDEFFVSECLNVGVSSFGDTKDEAVANLKEAVELYFEGEENAEYTSVDLIEVGSAEVYA